ncbi:MAG: CTP synthase [Oscillospiraceae bacterium]|jgi:CTP synthase|nr:CTP synthase [Oscillospiraceae bacterium]
MKYVFVTGGVVSSLGKGITAASLGRLLKARGYRVSLQKMDPYYNIDPGMLSPLMRGEAFITDDGAPADHDLGHYERFLDTQLRGGASVSTGKIHLAIMDMERRGAYRGGTIQMVPHVTDEIKRRIVGAARDADSDIAIVEIGGTVGDMEGAPFLEAIRQMRWDYPEGDCCFVHVTLLPTVGAEREIKTKPTQHSVKTLRSIGIQPDFVVCRTDVAISDEARGKISLFCNVPAGHVIAVPDAPVLYEAPLLMEAEGFAQKTLAHLRLPAGEPRLDAWRAMVDRAKSAARTLRVGLVGKYVEIHDAYVSAAEALRHAGYARGAAIDIRWISAGDIERDPDGPGSALQGLDAILAPSGHGRSGAEGIIQTAIWAHERGVPYLAIGYGMHMTVVAAARTLLGRPLANSTQANPDTPDPVVRVPKDRQERLGEGSRGSDRARLGGQDLLLSGNGKLTACYGGAREVRERHDNRYEVNPAYVPPLAEKGVRFPAMEKHEGYIEAIERPDHPFYVGVIYHPEFLSRPDRPHPLFDAFIAAALSGADG